MENIKLSSTIESARKLGFKWQNYKSSTKSMIQQWLREIHNIHVEPSFDYLKNDYNCIFNAKYNGKWEQYTRYYSTKTYEDALELGLQEAFTLLK